MLGSGNRAVNSGEGDRLHTSERKKGLTARVRG